MNQPTKPPLGGRNSKAAMQNGVIYVAKGPDYYDLAVQSALSLRAHNPGLAIDIFTDQLADPMIFDQGHRIPEGGPTAKLAALPQTRFDRTLYLDCDTLILTGLGDLFDILDRFDLAATHDVRRTSPMIREGFAHATPYAFPQMNAGVLLYRRVPLVDRFLADWQAAYANAGRDRDQVTFRDLLWSSDLRFYVLPPEFNLRRVTMLDAWEPLDARPTIVHSHRLLQHLRGPQPRLHSLADILPLERTALAEEWQAAAEQVAQAQNDPANPAARFHAAERALGHPDPAMDVPVADMEDDTAPAAKITRPE